MRFIVLIILSIPLSLFSQPYHQPDAAKLKLDLEKLAQGLTVLYIAAHPDDENTRLISWLIGEKKARTAYLSLTRGDGGQNLIGTEKAELLGVIRTQELLAARKVDGAEQYFTRAIDFGYSKTPEETFEKWGKQNILSDVVWVIRNFRPDIIITRFPATGEGGHGHHTASAILAKEAFEAAGNKEEFKWQLEYVEPWQAKRLVWNTFLPQRDAKADTSGLIKLDVGDYNSLLGKSYGEIASESRSMHKSQGFGSAKTRGPVIEYFKNIAGEVALKDIFEGIDTDLNRIPGSPDFKKVITEINTSYNFSEPQHILPLLFKAYELLPELKDKYWQAQKKLQLENLIAACMGLWVEALAKDYSAVPGQEMIINTSVLLRNNFPVSLTGIKIINIADTILNETLLRHHPKSFTHLIQLPENIDYTTPSWLERPATEGLFVVDKPELIALPQGPPALEVVFNFSSGKNKFSIQRPLVYKWTDPIDGEKYRPFEILPELMLNFNQNVYVCKEGENLDVSITLKAGKEKVNGRLDLVLPPEWNSVSENQTFSLNRKEEEITVNFKVFPPVNYKSDNPIPVKAVAESGDKSFDRSITRVEYAHIPIQTLITEAKSKLVPLDINIDKIKIGYIPGADDIPVYLAQLGYDLTMITDNMIETVDLNQFDAIITGIRAFNISQNLKLNHRKLLQYVEKGGNLLVQYNTSNFTGTIDFQIGPYPFKITRNRVTDENSPVSFINPDHALLNYPNKITGEDFNGWVQERGIYFAGELHENYQPLLEMGDKGEEQQQGSLIVADYGKGSFIYTGLSFFRQLPEGVPGAYRLFVNLLSYKRKIEE